MSTLSYFCFNLGDDWQRTIGALAGVLLVPNRLKGNSLGVTAITQFGPVTAMLGPPNFQDLAESP